MDIENFIASHKNRLQVDKHNLTLNNSPDKEMHNKDVNYISKSKIEKTAKNCNAIHEKHKQCTNNNNNANMDFLPKNNIYVNDPTTRAQAGAGVQPLQSQRTTTTATMCMNSPPMATTPLMHNQQNTPNPNVVDQNYLKNNENLGRDYCGKKSGNALVKTAKNLANLNERQSADIVDGSQIQKNEDDMEQWVSDTFYSYFPGYNNENKRRQEILHDRQIEYQQNFIKHQMNESNANSGKKKHAHSHLQEENTQQNFSTDENHKQLTSRSSDKTDLEIIVNNPDYEGRSPRPGSARHKLLQDLKHTEISNIVNNDGVTERNRRNAEMEMVKKKDYQKELLAQIEEKRRSIEVLKEKERRQEEALTRKLQEQLKTMHLQEELEKEKMRADKVRFDSEQNRLMREHLLTKLENDAKLLSSAQKSRSENEKKTPDENKVYKYFSNSARHEFRREPAHEPPAFHLDVPPPSTTSFCRKKCFHEIKDNIMCPFCDSTLKSYESWCLKCERRIFENAETDLRLLVCENCKKLYSVCLYCDKDGPNNCSHCQRNQNCCANCRKTLCADCIYAISLGKNSKQKADSERSFEVLEINYTEDEDEDKPTSNDLNNNYERNRPPYSMNIDRNSIFHHDFDRSKLYNDENNIEGIRHETDKRLSRYFKNYGDLACKGLRDRSTQTTPDSALRRDIVMVEENNLSMPLLREMPRMTRKESNMQQAQRKRKGTRIENLARKWEVPAVQKHTITTNSPKVLTQLGAIRKQLQSQQLDLDFNENK